jgi:hypothetical protein
MEINATLNWETRSINRFKSPYLQNSHTNTPGSACEHSTSHQCMQKSLLCEKSRRRLPPTKSKTGLSKHYWTSTLFKEFLYLWWWRMSAAGWICDEYYSSAQMVFISRINKLTKLKWVALIRFLYAQQGLQLNAVPTSISCSQHRRCRQSITVCALASCILHLRDELLNHNDITSSGEGFILITVGNTRLAL